MRRIAAVAQAFNNSSPILCPAALGNDYEAPAPFARELGRLIFAAITVLSCVLVQNILYTENGAPVNLAQSDGLRHGSLHDRYLSLTRSSCKLLRRLNSHRHWCGCLP